MASKLTVEEVGNLWLASLDVKPRSYKTYSSNLG
jgi:hypothetical protein